MREYKNCDTTYLKNYKVTKNCMKWLMAKGNNEMTFN
jgi:hypothetical protein